jgi:hypothetical protein
MVLDVTRGTPGAGRTIPVLAALASAFLLSSCAGFDPFHWTDAPAPQAAPPAVEKQAEVVPTPKPEFWPTRGWRYTSPEAQGLDSTVLANALETIRARHIPVNSLLIERHGNIVLDAYFHPYTEDEPHDVASVT